jgi:anti-sigma-K factor RskA
MNATTNDQQCEEVRELLGAYALGALEPDERSFVAAHLATCAACRAEAASYALVVDALGVAAPRETPPESLRSRVLASARGQESQVSAATVSVAATSEKAPKEANIWQGRFVKIVSAAAILLLIGVGVLAYLLAQALDERDDAKAAQAQMAAYLSSGAQTVAMTELPASNYKDEQGHGTVLMGVDKPTMVFVGGCPPSNDSRTYRVWVAVNGQRTPVGTLEVGDDWNGWLTVETPEAITAYDQIGVTMVTNGDQRDDLFIAKL